MRNTPESPTPWARTFDGCVERTRFPQPVSRRRLSQALFGFYCALGGICLALFSVALVAMAIGL